MANRPIKNSVNKLNTGVILKENLYDSFENILLGDGIALKEPYLVEIKGLDILKAYIKDKSQKTHSTTKKIIDNHPYLTETRSEVKNFTREAIKNLYLNENQIQETFTIIEKLVDGLLENEEIIIGLARLRSIDNYTLKHSVNVCVLSLVIGVAVGLTHDELRDLGEGAILHDIGKMLIPQEILNKSGALTIDEYDIVKQHTTYGYDILKRSKNISPIAAEVALSHHERLDGNGYPFGKVSSQINTYAKIVSLSDVYDALTSDRVYKRKIEAHKALGYICAMINSQFDNDIVKNLLRCTGIYPLGSLVKLNTNEIGLVVDINKLDSSKPVVRILLDEKGEKVKSYFEIDTRMKPEIEIVDIFPKFDGGFDFSNL